MYLRTFIVIFAMTSCASDLIYGKISNHLWIFGTVSGFLINILQTGRSGMWTAFSGSLLPLAAGALLFYFRMLGAGDIKELSGLGAVAGAGGILKIGLCGVLLGAGISLLLLIGERNAGERFRYLYKWIGLRIVRHQKIPYRNSPKSSGFKKKDLSTGTFHFTVPVYLAVLLYAGGLL